MNTTNTLITPQIIRTVAEAEDDFGHEMRIGQVLKTLADSFDHGGTYLDPVTSKPRQFDFRASFVNNEKRIQLAVEAKNLSPSMPLVVCGTARRREESFFDAIVGQQDARGCRKERLNNVNVYERGRFVGKSAFRVQSKNGLWVKMSDSDVYERWAQALASCRDLCEKAVELSVYTNTMIITLPVLVVSNNSLWQVEYDDEGNCVTDPHPVESCSYYVDHTITLNLDLRFTYSHLHFFTFDGFSKWMEQFHHPRRVAFEEWFRAFRRSTI